jgi:hypothetical protein
VNDRRDYPGRMRGRDWLWLTVVVVVIVMLVLYARAH